MTTIKIMNTRKTYTASMAAPQPQTAYFFGASSWTRCTEIALDVAARIGAAAIYALQDDARIVAAHTSADEIDRSHPDLYAIVATNWGEPKVNSGKGDTLDIPQGQPEPRTLYGLFKPVVLTIDDSEHAEFSGRLIDWAKMNDGISDEEIDDIRADLATKGWSNCGGGAAPVFTLMTPDQRAYRNAMSLAEALDFFGPAHPATKAAMLRHYAPNAETHPWHVMYLSDGEEHAMLPLGDLFANLFDSQDDWLGEYAAGHARGVKMCELFDDISGALDMNMFWHGIIGSYNVAIVDAKRARLLLGQ